MQLKAFLPQLQSTFVKALQETSSMTVRLCAGGALSRLVAIHIKPDAVVVDVGKVSKACDDGQIM